MSNEQNTTGWGVTKNSGVEIIDADPVFAGDVLTWKAKKKLFLTHPKKFLLFRAIQKDIRKKHVGDLRDPYSVLDVGSGSGADIIDMKKLFGRHVFVTGTDTSTMQNDVATQKIKHHGVYADIALNDGQCLPYDDMRFDAVYSSNALTRAHKKIAWLAELYRVLKPDGLFALSTVLQKSTVEELLNHTPFDIERHWKIQGSLVVARKQ